VSKHRINAMNAAIAMAAENLGKASRTYAILEELAITLARVEGFIKQDWEARRTAPMSEDLTEALAILDQLSAELHTIHDEGTK